MAQYFTPETDEYIMKFNASEDVEERHKLFNEGIRPALEKLTENLIFVYKFFTLADDVETLKQDCLSNFYNILPKFDPYKNPDKVTKGFSYFNVVGKNWFIQKSREKSKRLKTEKELHVDMTSNSIANDHSMIYDHCEKKLIEREFWQSFFTELDFWRSRMVKKNESKVLEAVIFLLKNPELAPIYNKKAVYLYLREMTGLNEKQVAMNLKKMRELYFKWKVRYHDED